MSYDVTSDVNFIWKSTVFSISGQLTAQNVLTESSNNVQVNNLFALIIL